MELRKNTARETWQIEEKKKEKKIGEGKERPTKRESRNKEAGSIKVKKRKEKRAK